MNMFRKLLIVMAIFAMIVLTACAGTEENEDDTIPPITPVLTPHLGDTGDPPVAYEGQPVILSEDNNGIDAVPDGDWIKMVWDPFKDTDLSHVKIYRFSNFDPEPVLIDSISSSEDYYLDTGDDITERVFYSYFIDLVDQAGNASRSDTTTYSLLSKAILLTPENNATISPISAEFKWNRSGTAAKYRLVVWDENYQYVWHQDLVTALEEDPLSIIMPNNIAAEYSGRSLRWRVDSFDTEDGIVFNMGSESYERIVHIQ
jgi:hypothetical protein